MPVDLKSKNTQTEQSPFRAMSLQLSEIMIPENGRIVIVIDDRKVTLIQKIDGELTIDRVTIKYEE